MTQPSEFSAIVGFDALYGLEVLELSPEFARARVELGPQHLQPFGLVHGGVHASVAESLASRATAACVVPNGQVCSGMSNQTSFLRPLTGGTITANAVRRHAGRTTWIWEVEIRDDDQRLCALSQMTIAVRDAVG